MNHDRLVVSINSCWNFVNFRSGLIRHLVAEGYEVVAVAPPDPHVAKLEALGCRFVPIGMDSRGISPVKDAKLLADYLRILRRERPAAYLGYTIKPNVYGSIAAHRLGIPVINNIAGLGIAFARNDWLNKVVRLLYRLALGRSNTVFFQNRDDRELFLAAGFVNPARARILPGSGVDLRRFSPQPASPGDGLSFVLIARLLRTKGVADFVEAARLVRAQRGDARFRIAGIFDEAHRDGISRAEMDAWVGEGAVEYLGALDDVRPALAAADCVVLPTFYPEGTPRGLLEAAAMGKPIITTNVPGCRDVVEEGVNGYLCSARDPAGLAAAMIRVLDLPVEIRARMGSASRAKAVAEYDERIVIERYLEAVRSAAPFD